MFAELANLANFANFARCLEDLFGDYDIILYFCRKIESKKNVKKATTQAKSTKSMEKVPLELSMHCVDNLKRRHSESTIQNKGLNKLVRFRLANYNYKNYGKE